MNKSFHRKETDDNCSFFMSRFIFAVLMFRTYDTRPHLPAAGRGLV